MYLVQTENGRLYKIDLERGLWSRSKNRNDDTEWLPAERLLILRDYLGDSETPMIGSREKDVGFVHPKHLLGKHMYISSFNLWYATSAVVSVVEVDA